MAIKTKKVVVAGHEVEFSTFGGRAAIRLGRKLLKYASPLVGSLGVGKDLKALAIGGEALAKVLDAVVSDESTDQFIMELLGTTFIDSKDVSLPAVFDEVFAGEIGLLFGVLREIIVENFSSVFGGLLTSEAKK